MNRLLSVALVLAWLAPSAGAVGLCLHVAFEHDGHDGDHRAEIVGLALNVAHVHRHDFCTVPHHHHGARLDAKVPHIKAGPSVLTTLLTTPTRLAAPVERSRIDRSRRRGPSKPLFTTHCSLLL